MKTPGDFAASWLGLLPADVLQESVFRTGVAGHRSRLREDVMMQASVFGHFLQPGIHKRPHPVRGLILLL